ncbi:MAG: TIGR03564 family F420-dependent LLM class oxidoreductase [Gammaproteobacteria bacterium]|nr:TIGR03564 family F420-dependent LLM class oxidoreductase [Gammaproteobacteria bacterium]HJP35663.1 TIGR03564 family F420-dependent LLM class oxidoreductase [Gammaproteobacteria bacterium]
MRIGLMAEPFAASLEDIKKEVTLAQDSGAHTYWLAQLWRYDALTLIPTLAAMAPDVEFASGVVASYLRHPMTLASQALTTSLLTKGKFTLGVGLMHKPVIESMFEMSFERPARHMREYLDILLPLLEQKNVDASGASVSYHGGMDVPDAPPCPVMLAALGPMMLRLCGARTDGTIMWMTGPETLRGYVLPALTAAAEEAGREAPRMAALIPIIITADAKAGRELAAKLYAPYGEMPSYRAMLVREGLGGPEDYALIGSEAQVRDRLAAYEAAGVTDCGLQIAGAGEMRARAMEFVAALAGERGR